MNDNSENGRSLPDGWEWSTLGEVTENFDGKRVPVKASNRETMNGEYPYYGASGIIDHVNDYLFDGDFLLIAEDGANLLSRSTPIAFQAHRKFWVNNHAHIVKTRNGMPLGYLEHYLNSLDLKFSVTGTAQPKLTQANLNKIPVPLPPLPEQERIVNRIEELFSDLDAGMAALKRVRVGLKRYKMSVLKAAFEGRLVSQDKSIEPATVLLERVLGKDYVKEIAPSESNKVPFIPTGWAYGKLEKLIYIAGRIGWRGLKADEYTQEGPLFLSVYNLNKGDHVDFSDTYHISQERYDESPEIMLQENDILLAKDGAGIGKIGIVKDLPGQATVNSSLLVIRASEIFIPEFLFYLLKGPQMQDIVRARITGSATPHLFQRDIKKFTLLIPPLDEQRRIVAEVERRLSVVGEVESAVEVGLVRAGRLRQSVLRSAFEGRL